MSEISSNVSLGENYYENITNGVGFEECFKPSISTIDSPIGRWFLIVLYSFVSIAALLGNSIVIIVELKGKESSPTIRKYLIGLAVSDIIFGVFCVPFSYSNFMLGQWIHAHWLCPTTQYVQLLSVFVTSLTLSLIGVERYLAILHPFSHLHRWLEDHINLVLITVWALGAMFGPILFKKRFVSPITLDNNTTEYKCSQDFSRRRLYVRYYVILTFLLPLGVTILSYFGIMRKLIKDQSTNTIENADQLRRSSPPNHQSKIIKMLFTIIMLFIIRSPFNLYKIFLEYEILTFCTEFEFNTLVWSYFACHWISMASSFINPIIYSFMSQTFRIDFNNTFRKSSTNNNKQISMRSKTVQPKNV